MRETEAELSEEIQSLREQLRLKDAALQNRRAALAEIEVRLGGRVQELAVELAHERERSRKHERELKKTRTGIAATQLGASNSSCADARGSGDSGAPSALPSRAAQHRGRFSLAKKRRWKSW